jgi:hypothetical protein
MISAVQDVTDPQSATATGTTPTRMNASPARLRTLMAAGRMLDTHDPAVVRQTATQFLSELFFALLLAEAREFTLGGELAHGGQTESIFGQRLDQILADGVAGADPGLVNNMVQHFEQFAQRCSPGSDKASWPTRTQLKQQAEGVPS